MLTLGTPPAWRGAAIGLSAGANAAGRALGQLSGSVIAGTIGIRSVFLCTSGVLALVCAAVTMGIKEPASSEEEAETPGIHAPMGTVAVPAKKL